MSFLDNYAEYASGNEAPTIFHKWSAISVLSSAISRRIWLDAGFFTIYTNMYIVLVGEPAGGKTTAMDIARQMVQRLDMPVAPSTSTREAITQLMSGENDNSPCTMTVTVDGEPRIYTHLSMFASEMVVALSSGGNPQGFIEFLTEIYDRELFEYRTKGRGVDVIQGPYITLLGCMTPEQTDQMLKQSIITGGFSRRCIFVYSVDRGAPVPRPTINPKGAEAYKKCMEDCKIIRTRKGEFQTSEAADKFFDEWYCMNYEKRGQPLPAVLKNYLRSKAQLVWKVSMLIALSDNPKCQLVLEPHHIQRAIHLLDEIEPFITKVFEGTGRNVLSDLAAKISTYLGQAPNWVPLKKLYADMFDYGDRDEIGKALHHLKETDKVVAGEVRHGGSVVGQVVTTKENANKIGPP